MSDNKISQIPNFVEREFNEQAIRQRNEDGYFDATAMCRVANKRWVDYSENQSTQLFLKELSKSENLALLKLVQSKHGRYGGTWIHPYVAVNLASFELLEAIRRKGFSIT